MTSITFVCDKEDMTPEAAENWAEAVLEKTGMKGFCDRILVNNKEVWKLGDPTPEDIFRNKASRGD